MAEKEPSESLKANSSPDSASLKKALVVSVNGKRVRSLGADTDSLDVGLLWFGGSREELILSGTGMTDQNHLAGTFSICAKEMRSPSKWCNATKSILPVPG